MNDQSQKREQWESPQLECKGSVGEVLQSGGHKLSIMADDPGTVRQCWSYKPKCKR